MDGDKCLIQKCCHMKLTGERQTSLFGGDKRLEKKPIGWVGVILTQGNTTFKGIVNEVLIIQ